MESEPRRGGRNSIKRNGGIKSWIDTRTDIGSASFVEAMEQGVSIGGKSVRKATIQDVMNLYGVSRGTAKKWIVEYISEYGKPASWKKA